MSQAGIFSISIAPGTVIETLTGDVGLAVSPDANNNINIKGDGTTILVVGNIIPNTLTISTTGIVPISFPTDVGGPSVPAAGVLNILGGNGIITSTFPTTNTVTITSTGLAFEYVSIDASNSPYLVQTQDDFISVDTSAGPVTVLLPNTAVVGIPFYIKDRTGDAEINNITISTLIGTVNIDGAPTFIMNSEYQSVSVVGNSTTYEFF